MREENHSTLFIDVRANKDKRTPQTSLRRIIRETATENDFSILRETYASLKIELSFDNNSLLRRSIVEPVIGQSD